MRAYPGPLLLKNVELDGFRIGLEVRHTEYSVTMENVLLHGQSVCGIWNYGNNLSIRGLESHLSVPAVRNDPISVEL